jgi:hypothetical protein
MRPKTPRKQLIEIPVRVSEEIYEMMQAIASDQERSLSNLSHLLIKRALERGLHNIHLNGEAQ